MTENGSEYMKYKNEQLKNVPKFVKKSAPTNSTNKDDAKAKAFNKFKTDNQSVQGEYYAHQQWAKNTRSHEQLMHDVLTGRKPKHDFKSKAEAINVLKNNIDKGWLGDVSFSNDGRLRVYGGFQGHDSVLYDAVLHLANSHSKKAEGSLLIIDVLN